MANIGLTQHLCRRTRKGMKYLVDFGYFGKLCALIPLKA